jgi:hypothetical protein
VRNSGWLINEGTINNYSSNTLDNQGTLTNTGTINNASAGKITNTGTIDNEGEIINGGEIDNANGTIDNEGGTFQSVQTKEDMGGAINGEEVELIGSGNSTTLPANGGSGGCNAGFGLFGLLPLAVWVARKRMTA